LCAWVKKAPSASRPLPDLTFYNAGRHSFASNWVIAGQDVYRLSEILGHSSVVVTQRYAHLGASVPERVLAAVDVDLAEPG
jgi:integrase